MQGGKDKAGGGLIGIHQGLSLIGKPFDDRDMIGNTEPVCFLPQRVRILAVCGRTDKQQMDRRVLFKGGGGAA